MSNTSAFNVSRGSENFPDRTEWWLVVGIIGFYLLLYLLPLGARPLIVPDETRYAEIPREILATGDWVVPRYDGLRYFEKPPMGYWINAVSIAVFGENTFAARLPSALAAGLTSILIFLFVRSALRSRRLAWYATLIHLSFLEVYTIGTVSVLDNFLSLFLTGGILSFYLAAQAAHRKQALLYWVLSGVFLGLAFLTKGFLALSIPVIVMVPWMLWQGKWRGLLTYGWLVVGVAALVALPWAILVHLRESDFWHYFFWVEHIQRFTSSDAQHKAPFYYYMGYLPLLAFPWLALMPAAISGLKTQGTQHADAPLFRFLWLWLLMPFLFFSASSGKLATYILPCFPPMALLITVGLHSYLQRTHLRAFNVGLLVNGVMIVIALATLLAVQFFDAGDAAYGAQESLSLAGVVTSLIIVLLGGIVAFKSKSEPVRLGAIALSVLPIFFVGHFAYPDRISMSKSPSLLVQKYAEQIPADAIVVADSYIIGAVAWALNRHDIYLSSPGELRYGVMYPDAPPSRLLTAKSFTELLVQNRSAHAVAIFCTEGCKQDLLEKFPSDSLHNQYGLFELWIFPKQGGDVKP